MSEQIVREYASSSSPHWVYLLDIPPKDCHFMTTDVTSNNGTIIEDFCLQRNLLLGIFEKGWERPSPIQEAAIPTILKGEDILARAKNGTGKTGAYAIPILEQINPRYDYTQALVIVPSRELAVQTCKIFMELGKYLNVRIMFMTGGIKQLKVNIVHRYQRAHIIIATPRRIVDLLAKGIANVSQCTMVVLDEADTLLSNDFCKMLNYIMSTFIHRPQLLLFSATFPIIIQRFVDEYLQNPYEINLTDELTLKGVTQYYARVEEWQKVRSLYALFGRLPISQAIIFCNSVQRVEWLSKEIAKLGYSCYYIHAKMKQSHRNRIFHEFSQGLCRTLICTDLFTRGIDVQGVNVVINFDFPRFSDIYLHRIGRSGRFGHLGLAINFVTFWQRHSLWTFEKELNTEIKPLPKRINPALYVANANIINNDNEESVAAAGLRQEEFFTN